MKFLFILLAAFDIFCDSNLIGEFKTGSNFSKDRAAVIRQADKYLEERPAVITDKPLKFVKDPHHYVSLCIYWWPDEKNPGGPYVRRDGHINPEIYDYDAPKLDKACARLDKFALAYYITGEEKYSKAYIEQLKIWFLNKRTYMYPSLDYSEIRIGHNGNKGTCYGIIQAYGNLTNVVESARLMESLGQLDKKTVSGLKKWYKEFAEWLTTSDMALEEKNCPNNHSIAYDVLLTSVASYGEDWKTVERVRADFRKKRLEPQIEADGRMPMELARTRALHYSVYNLEHIVDFCVLQERMGVKYYAENKDLIDKPFNYLMQFVDDRSSFPYQEISSWDAGVKRLLATGKRLSRLASQTTEYRAEVFSLLDLDRPGLERVKASVEKKDYDTAAAELLAYYRVRPEVRIQWLDLGAVKASEKDRIAADDALKHVFHVMAGPPLDYGRNINWEYWPIKDIEIRVQLHRQPWWASLARMYYTTKDEKYSAEYVYELRDWVRKNPYKPFEIDQHGTVSSGTIDINSPNECFSWRPLEIGTRLERWIGHFALMSGAQSFTPEFLLEFLKSYHENAEVLMRTFSPAGNHLIHQSQGAILAGIYFPEFKNAESWLRAGADNLNKEIFRQTCPDGCHMELDPGYQAGLLESYNSSIVTAGLNGRGDLFTEDCLERLEKVARYSLENLYPDYSQACLSDARRELEIGVSVYKDIFEYRHADSTLLWFATRGHEGKAPSYKTSGHPETGFYTFRDGWFDGQIVMPFKATERGMWHAQPDFGTFELYAYGKYLMPDAGAYTYSGDEEIERQRAYFKATARHNALTLDDRDYDDPKPKVLEWKPDGKVQTLTVQHEAYEGLTRRRHVAFVEEKFFVIVDEVSGPATGTLRLRNGLGATGSLERKGNAFTYRDGDAGLRLVVSGPEGSSTAIEKDWTSAIYRVKEERPVICMSAARKSGAGAQRFVTVICPFKGDSVPSVKLGRLNSANGKLSLSVFFNGKSHTMEF